MRRLLIVALAMLSAIAQGTAQTVILVTGKVTDEKGASIAGATVTQKGTPNATTRNDDGAYTQKHPYSLQVNGRIG